MLKNYSSPKSHMQINYILIPFLGLNINLNVDYYGRFLVLKWNENLNADLVFI